MLTLAFDVYGTLIDTHGVVQQLETMIGSQARQFSQCWRDKQLEYSFRRGLMQSYQPFSVCTRQALEYTDQLLNTGLNSSQQQLLLASYASLPAFADASTALQQLQTAGLRLYAFSNGQQAAVEQLLSQAGLREYFAGIISVDDVQSFKPDPAVYQHFLQQTDSQSESTWLISSNPFDVIGAASHGWQTAWIQRQSRARFDPWEQQPAITLPHLNALAEYLL